MYYQRMGILRFVILFLITLTCSIPVGGLTYTHDELVWTKKFWSAYKLNFPWAIFHDREPDVKQLMQGPFADLRTSSLTGPFQNLPELVKKDIERLKNEPGNFAVGPLDDKGSLETAALVSQCKVCTALAVQLWTGLTNWMHVTFKMPTREQLLKYGEDICDIEVPVEVLKEWIILQAKVHDANEKIVYDGDQFVEFYLFSKRQRQHATVSEISAVKRACHAVLAGKTLTDVTKLTTAGNSDGSDTTNSGMGTKEEEDPYDVDSEDGDETNTTGEQQNQQEQHNNNVDILAKLYSLLEQYHEQLVPRAVSEGKKGPPDSEITPPTPQRECFDKHPQCEYWARVGECSTNPKYMVATEDKGFCRKSCRVCTPPPAPQLQLSETSSSYLKNVSSSLMEQFKTTSCTNAAPCKWTGANPTEVLQKAGPNFRKSAVAQSASYVAGPSSGAVQQIQSDVTNQVLKQSQILFTRNFQRAIVPSSKKLKSPVEKPSSTSPSPPPPVIQKLLHNHLRETCVYSNAGWWNYEICYQAAITQFHSVDAQQETIDWEISLGKYQSADWTIKETNDTILYRSGTIVPYVSHYFDQGNHCDLDPEAAVVEGVPSLKRSSELRFMCSPDLSGHVTVVEPTQCRYVVDVYLPQICDLPPFEPTMPLPQQQTGVDMSPTHAKISNAPPASSQSTATENKNGDATSTTEKVKIKTASPPAVANKDNSEEHHHEKRQIKSQHQEVGTQGDAQQQQQTTINDDKKDGDTKNSDLKKDDGDDTLPDEDEDAYYEDDLELLMEILDEYYLADEL